MRANAARRSVLTCLATLLMFSPMAAFAGLEAIFLDGFESRNTLAWTSEQPPLEIPTVYRLADLDLRDPHAFVDVPLIGCSDVTESFPLAPGFGLNEQLQTAITTDGTDTDSDLDLSYLLGFRPLDLLAVDGRLDFGRGACPAPAPPATCDWLIPPVPLTVDYDGAAAGTCLEPLAGTTNPAYAPPIGWPEAPCFSSAPAPMTISALGVEIPIQSARFGAAFVGGTPPTGLQAGLWFGFLRESDADAILLPAGLPIVGGQPLSVLFPGGTSNCAAHDDRDEGPDAELGWWLYFNFPASPVPFTGR